MATKTGDHSKEWLKEMQALPLPQKIVLTKARIREAIFSSFGKCYVAFSGGKDSGVLLHLVAQVWKQHRPNEVLHVIFTDTGNEYLDIAKFVPEYVNFIEDTVGVKIELHRPKPTLDGKTVTFMHVCKQIGYPIASKKISKQIETIRQNFQALGYTKKQTKDTIVSLEGLTDIKAADQLRQLGVSKTVVLALTGVNSHNKRTIGWKISARWKPLIWAPFKCSNKCCDILKKHPAAQLSGDLGLTLAFIGEMADDGVNREQAYLKTGCNAFNDSGVGKSKPMGFWTEQDVLRYYKNTDIPYCRVYGELLEDSTGKLRFSDCCRTGCKLCLFGIQFDRDRIDVLYNKEPKIVDYAMKPKSENGLDYQRVLSYIENQCNVGLVLPDKYRKDD